MSEAETVSIQGYIVLDDYYGNPASGDYELFWDKEDAVQAATDRLRDILKRECNDNEGQQEMYDKLCDDLETMNQACIQSICGGWNKDSAFIRVAQAYRPITNLIFEKKVEP